MLYRRGILLEELSKGSYMTANDLAEIMKVSEKTVRTDIKTLDEILSNYGAYIQPKQRLGYLLIIEDAEKYKQYLAENNSERKVIVIPKDSEERVQFILTYFLFDKQYMKIDDLAYDFYVSRTTLIRDIKRVELLLNKYEVFFERKPRYGIRVVGTEFNVRKCYANYIVKNELWSKGEMESEEYISVATIVLSTVEKNNIHMSEIAFNNLVTHIYVGLLRLDTDHSLQLKDIEEFEKSICSESAIAEVIAKKLEIEFSIIYPKDEIVYIAIHLAAKRVYSERTDEGRLTIPPRIEELSRKMLISVNEVFAIDFIQNLDLKMVLCQHLVSLDIRLKFGIKVKNPLLNDIKNKFILSYIIATQSVIPLVDYYKQEISEDEIANIALHFTLALEQENNKITKKNILIVCSTGQGSAKLLKYKYMKEFGDYIGQIYLCDFYEVEHFDYNRVNYVFTTIPLIQNIPVPILEIGEFLEDDDINQVKYVLSAKDKKIVDYFYKPDLFIKNVKATNKNEVIQILCLHLSKKFVLPSQFYKLVVKRESLASTDFGNLIAFPHPYQPVLDISCVCVAVLDKPIFWERNLVQVVLLVNIAKNETVDLQKFYNLTTAFMTNSEKIKSLINEASYEKFYKLLME